MIATLSTLTPHRTHFYIPSLRALTTFATLVTLGCFATLHALAFLCTHWSVAFKVIAAYRRVKDIKSATSVLVSFCLAVAPRASFSLNVVTLPGLSSSPVSCTPLPPAARSSAISLSRAARSALILRCDAPRFLPQVAPAGYGPSSRQLLVPLERRLSAPAPAQGATADGQVDAQPEASFEVFRRRFVWDGGERCFRKVAFFAKDTFGCAPHAWEFLRQSALDALPHVCDSPSAPVEEKARVRSGPKVSPPRPPISSAGRTSSTAATRPPPWPPRRQPSAATRARCPRRSSGR